MRGISFWQRTGWRDLQTEHLLSLRLFDLVGKLLHLSLGHFVNEFGERLDFWKVLGTDEEFTAGAVVMRFYGRRAAFAGAYVTGKVFVGSESADDFDAGRRVGIAWGFVLNWPLVVF